MISIVLDHVGLKCSSPYIVCGSCQPYFLFFLAVHPLNFEKIHDITVPLPESVWKHLVNRLVY